MCIMSLNPELNGIELTFKEKPEQSIINLLKEVGYRWHNVKKLWYAKQNEKTLKTAKELSDNTTELKTVTTSEAEQKELFYPNYTEVDGMKIYKNSDIDFTNGYFYDINSDFYIYTDRIIMTDLSNALKIGKTCKRIYIDFKTWNSENNINLYLYNELKIKTVKQLYEAIKNNVDLKELTIAEQENKSIETFSPFIEGKPIKTPEKWTIPHVWKGILSGQIFKGEKAYHYTDDYAYDAADNFGTGRHLNLFSVAKDLIESSSKGFSVVVECQTNGITKLSVNNYSFDCNDLYYDEKCNLKEGEQRRNKEAEELANYNQNMLNKVIEVKPEDISRKQAYKVEYIEEDENTHKYHIKSEILQYNNIFYTDTIYNNDGTEKEEITVEYKIINIKPLEVIKNKLYEISNTFDRLDGEKAKEDERIINSGCYIHYVTGKALSELMQEGKCLPIIKEDNKSLERLEKELHAHYEAVQDGNFTMRMSSSLFTKDETDYRKEHKKLLKEMARLED